MRRLWAPVLADAALARRIAVMTAVDILPLQQSAVVALAFWGAVVATFLALLGLYIGLAVRGRKRRRGPN